VNAVERGSIRSLLDLFQVLCRPGGWRRERAPGGSPKGVFRPHGAVATSDTTAFIHPGRLFAGQNHPERLLRALATGRKTWGRCGEGERRDPYTTQLVPAGPPVHMLPSDGDCRCSLTGNLPGVEAPGSMRMGVSVVSWARKRSHRHRCFPEVQGQSPAHKLPDCWFRGTDVTPRSGQGNSASTVGRR